MEEVMVNPGLNAWMLTSASLVLLMTPGLAFFYGGMVRSKSVLNMMMMSFISIGIVGVVYVLWGWSMSYPADATFGPFSGTPWEFFGLKDSIYDSAGEFILYDDGLAQIVDVGFQATFAIITVALVSGAIADRVKFSSWVLFVPIWVTISFFPLAYMVWGGGFLGDGENGLAGLIFGATDGVANVAPVDLAGGTVVHINAGVAGLVLALLVGLRKGFGKEPMRPHNLPFVMLGAGLLWFGWFGFNAGSAYEAGGSAGLVWVNTLVATCAAMLGWLLVEKIRDGEATSLGGASGVVAGLVAITPACGAVSPVGAIAVGVLAGVLCALAVGLKYQLNYDDSLDVVGVHLVGGLVGTLAIGLLATDGGLLYGDGLRLFVVQLAVAVFAMLWAAIATLIVGGLVMLVLGWRIPEEDEVSGIDAVEHGESGYDFGGVGGTRRGSSISTPAKNTVTEGADA